MIQLMQSSFLVFIHAEGCIVGLQGVDRKIPNLCHNMAVFRLRQTGHNLIIAHDFVNTRQYRSVVNIQVGPFSYASATTTVSNREWTMIHMLPANK